jgi:mannose-6-phosphate isomerase
MIDLTKFDKSKFTNTPFAMDDTTKPWGHEIIFTKPEDPYTGKIIYLNAGKQFSLQVHDKKQETQMLISGEATLIIDNEKGEMTEIPMVQFKGYTLLVGQRHRVRAVTDAAIYEVSTPETGTTYRLEDDYKRPDQTEELRANERKGL